MDNGAADGHDEVVDLIFESILDEGIDSPATGMMLQLASSGDFKACAEVISSLVDSGSAEVSGHLCKKIMAAHDGAVGQLEYSRVCHILGALVDRQQADAAYEVLRELVITPEPDAADQTAFDCTNVAYLLGSMVELGHPEWAGALAYKAYSEEALSSSDLAQLLPLILGTLLDYQKQGWVVQMAQQLLYSPADGASTDYGCLGWVLAQCVWLGRADWGAAVCADLRALRESWFELHKLLDAVGHVSDASYSQAITSCMPPPPHQHHGPGPYQLRASPREFVPGAGRYSPSGRGRYSPSASGGRFSPSDGGRGGRYSGGGPSPGNSPRGGPPPPPPPSDAASPSGAQPPPPPPPAASS